MLAMVQVLQRERGIHIYDINIQHSQNLWFPGSEDIDGRGRSGVTDYAGSCGGLRWWSQGGLSEGLARLWITGAWADFPCMVDDECC